MEIILVKGRERVLWELAFRSSHSTLKMTTPIQLKGKKICRLEARALRRKSVWGKENLRPFCICIVRDEKLSCLSFSSPIRPYPCLRGLSWNFSSRKRERAAKRRGETKTSGYLGLESRSRETSGTRVIRPSVSWLFVSRMLHVATQSINVELSLRSRRLEVVAQEKTGAREGDSPLACLPRARPFSLSPATSKGLLRRLRRTWVYRSTPRA